MVLSLSPGLGPDGLPSPGGYFPHIPTNGSGNNGLNGGGAGSNGNAGNPIGMGGSIGAGGARPGSSGSSGGSWSAGGATTAGHHGSMVQGAGAGQGGSGSCNSNNPSPVSMMGAAQNSHRSSPCNELLAAAMRSSAHATNAAGELHCVQWG